MSAPCYNITDYKLNIRKGISRKEIDKAWDYFYENGGDAWNICVGRGGKNFKFNVCLEYDPGLDELCDFFSKFVDDKSYIEWAGEGDLCGQLFRIKFFGKENNWEEIEATVTFDDPYELFVKRYEKKLPKKLKEQLEAWWTAGHV